MRALCARVVNILYLLGLKNAVFVDGILEAGT